MTLDIAKLSNQELIDRYADLWGFLVFHSIDPTREFLALEEEMANRGLQWHPRPNREGRRAHARKLRKKGR